MFEKCRYIPLSQLSEKCLGTFYSTSVEILSVLETLVQRITVKNLTIPHSDSGLDLFSSRMIGDSKVVG